MAKSVSSLVIHIGGFTRRLWKLRQNNLKLITNYYCRFVIVPHKRSLLLVCCRKGGHIRGGLLYFNFHDFNHQSIFFLVCKLLVYFHKTRVSIWLLWLNWLREIISFINYTIFKLSLTYKGDNFLYIYFFHKMIYL